tara:strand:- start:143 stop:493 length:351 start_codon:yes stop_codon:yes gene_type:complete
LKNLILTLAILFVTSSIFAQKEVKKNSQAYFEVNGVCIMCKKRIEIASLKVKGIKMATWDIPSNIIRVIYNPNKVEIKSLQKAIADIGHDTPLFKATKQSYNSLPKCCFYKEEKIH